MALALVLGLCIAIFLCLILLQNFSPLSKIIEKEGLRPLKLPLVVMLRSRLHA